VLVTPEARAFFVPNATLGLGFFVGAAYWWFVGARRWPEHRLHLARTLAFWLGVATLFTLRFWWLLIHLPALCPFCPWNHVFTYVAFAAALLVWRREAREHRGAHPPWQQLVPPRARVDHAPRGDQPRVVAVRAQRPRRPWAYDLLVVSAQVPVGAGVAESAAGVAAGAAW
jgi:hypothetical protein